MYNNEARERREAINTFAKMIERLEDLILTGMGVPFTPMTVVNGEKLVPLLDRIRENLPEEIQNAQRLLDHRDDIVNEAQARSNQMLQDAKRQAEFMLSESELLRAVHEEAASIRQQITMELEAMQKKAYEESEAMRAQAVEESRAIREGADQYADAILSNLDKSLVEFQSVVRNGQRYLQKARYDATRQAPSAQRPQAPYAVPVEQVPQYDHRESMPMNPQPPSSAAAYYNNERRQPSMTH